ncbi:MAG: hypothetical protein JST68_30525 [Bacteroidetes bacterium]|nr:hypothetical protein [Bacteroidota bacterium]
MKKVVFFFLLLRVAGAQAQGTGAQACQTSAELDALPGKYIDAAHCEYPAQRASWLNDLKTQANISMAGKVLTQIEGIERDSRKGFDLKGVVLKSSFSGRNLDYVNGGSTIAPYDWQLGCYEYICVNKKIMTNSEYQTVLRVYVNLFKDVEGAFDVTEAPYFLTAGRYDGKFIGLHYFYRVKDKRLLEAMNSGIGFYQDVRDEGVKQGNRSVYITRHWYITKAGQPVLVPVSRGEYLRALVEYYQRAKLGTALVDKALKEHDEGWLAKPAVVDPRSQKPDASVAVEFWDDKNGDVLYKLSPAYFSKDAAGGAGSSGTGVGAAAKPRMVELAYRYTKVPAGQRLVENFTKNFDFTAVQKMLE